MEASLRPVLSSPENLWHWFGALGHYGIFLGVCVCVEEIRALYKSLCSPTCLAYHMFCSLCLQALHSSLALCSFAGMLPMGIYSCSIPLKKSLGWTFHSPFNKFKYKVSHWNIIWNFSEWLFCCWKIYTLCQLKRASLPFRTFSLSWDHSSLRMKLPCATHFILRQPQQPKEAPKRILPSPTSLSPG